MVLSVSVLVPLIALLGLLVLMGLVARFDPKRRVNQLFIWFALNLAAWAFCSFMVYANLVIDPLFWSTVQNVPLMVSSVAYFHFIRAFLRKSQPVSWLSLGYGSCLLFAIASAFGYGVDSAYFSQGHYHLNLGIATYVMAPIALSFVGATIFQLMGAFRSARDAFVRNRAIYPLVGGFIVAICSVTNFAPVLSSLPLGHVGNLINACLLAYAVLMYRLLDISHVFRRGFVYSALTGFIVGVFFLVALLLQSAFHAQAGQSLWVSAVIMALIIAAVFRPAQGMAQRWIDRLFYREAYEYRHALRTASEKMNTMLNMEELADWLVDNLMLTMRAAKAGFFLLDKERGRYIPRALKGYDNPAVSHVHFREDNPVVRRLTKGDRCLTAEDMDRLPQLRSLWQSERGQLRQLETAVLIPLRAKDTLIGMIVLGPKLSGETYSFDDLELLTTVANQAAVAVENARLYEEARRAYEELKAAQDYMVQAERLRALGEMAGGVAHDFNNVLAVILGRAQLALEDAKEPRLRKSLQIIEQTALDAAKTVRRLQDLTRLRVDREFELVNLNQVVRSALQMVETRRAERCETEDAEIEISADLERIPPVQGEPAELGEALMNIILNAMDAMPEGGKITIKTEQQDRWVILSVSDTGIGIPEEIKGRIFDPFFTTKSAEGIGLGLSVTHGIIARHGGSIEVDSSPGKGSTFHIKLPVATGSGRRRRPAADMLSFTKRARILLVDDDPQVSEVLELMLTQLGNQVTVASRGREALSAFDQGDYELVITDLGMPDISGREVAKAVKEMRPGTPVVLITGWGVQLDPEEMEKIGIDGVIAKPFSKDALLARIAELLAGTE